MTADRRPLEFPEDRTEFLRRAFEAEEESLAVGGLLRRGAEGAADHAAHHRHEFSAGRLALGRFVEFSRRQRKLSVEEFAQLAGVKPSDLLQAEDEDAPAPEPPVLFAIAAFLGADAAKLMELAGHAQPSSSMLDEEAVRFAAWAQGNAPLTDDEEQVLRQFQRTLDAKRA